jgi:hypothetical protein
LTYDILCLCFFVRHEKYHVLGPHDHYLRFE